jgi:hypothetical protein
VASLALVKVHPNGRHQDEIEAFAARMDLRQIRQGIVDPDNICIGMKTLRMRPQLGGRLDRMNLKAPSGQGGRIAARAGADVKSPPSSRQKLEERTIKFVEDHAFIRIDKAVGLCAVSFRSRNDAPVLAHTALPRISVSPNNPPTSPFGKIVNG